MTVRFICNTMADTVALPHFWKHTIGSGHATLALRSDWQHQLRRCHDELGIHYVRFHGILSDDMSTLTKQGEQCVYSFFNTDQIIDFLLSIDMKPFVELSFMPTAIASGEKTVFHYKSNVTPPKDYEQWSTLIRKLLSHWVERYGLDEVQKWFFEVWNEPNEESFWTGSQQDYFKLYRHTAEAVKAVDEALRVGGPATARNQWIEDFIRFCERNDVPVDFVSTHHYPTDVANNQHSDASKMLAQVPRSILREQAQEVQRQAASYPVFYTEWNTSSSATDTLHDQPYAAAFVIKTIMEMNGLVDTYSFWTFTDIFEEFYMPSVPFHGGFGLLNVHDIAKPTYRAFQILHRLGDELLPVEGQHETVDCWVVRGDNQLTVLLTNTALPERPIQTEQVCITLQNVPDIHSAYIERIDDDHTNPRQLWVDMGEPEYLTPQQIEQLDDASRLERKSCTWTYENGTLTLELNIPPQAVASLSLELAKGESL